VLIQKTVSLSNFEKAMIQQCKKLKKKGIKARVHAKRG